jgi:protoporphyrinogen oxidase
MRYKYVIIGAGPTGIGAAYRLKELGITDFLVIEKDSYAGGLATTFKDRKGFYWDIGGHVQFSHYDYFNKLMKTALGEEGWLEHQRESWVWIKDRFVPYPFQNNIRYLPQEAMWECLQGIINRYEQVNTPPSQNFEDWIYHTFGDGIAQLFMLPYNFKVWAHPANKMDFGWIGERVAVSDLKRVSRNILFQQDDLSWGPNHTFQFPKKGGTGAIWKSLADQIGAQYFSFDKHVVAIDPNQKSIDFADGTQLRYDALLSTAPLDWLTKAVKTVPDQIRDKASGLKHSSSHIVGIGLKGQPPKQLASKCWMYFPEDNCPFYRVTVFSNYSPQNVPDSKVNWSLMAEISESEYKSVDRDKLIEDTIKGMLNTQLIDSKEAVVSTWQYTTEYGYPIPCSDRNGILEEVLPAMEELGVYSRGRFGAWKYEVSNQDHSAMQGVEWVNRMELQVPEVTVHFPNIANANWGMLI